MVSCRGQDDREKLLDVLDVGSVDHFPRVTHSSARGEKQAGTQEPVLSFPFFCLSRKLLEQDVKAALSSQPVSRCRRLNRPPGQHLSGCELSVPSWKQEPSSFHGSAHAPGLLLYCCFCFFLHSFQQSTVRLWLMVVRKIEPGASGASSMRTSYKNHPATFLDTSSYHTDSY